MKALNPWVHFSFGTVYAEVWPRFQNCNYVNNLQPYWNTYWLKNLTLDPNVLVVLRRIFVRKKLFFLLLKRWLPLNHTAATADVYSASRPYFSCNFSNLLFCSRGFSMQQGNLTLMACARGSCGIEQLYTNYSRGRKHKM